MSNDSHTLLCDIGGTHARFARFVKKGVYDNFRKYKLDEFQSFEEIVSHYRREMQGYTFSYARFSTARTPFQGRIEYKRHAGDPDYIIDFNIVEAQQGWVDVPYLNDLEAAAYGVKVLRSNQIETVVTGNGEQWNDHKIVISVGTGVGHAGIMNGAIMRTTGGHFLPVTVTDDHRAVEAYIRERKDSNFALIMEDFVSWRGLQSIASHVTGKDCYDHDAWDFLVILNNHPDIPRLFFEFLGLYAQTITSVTGFYGGIYLTGGVIDLLIQHQLTNWQAFENYFRPAMVQGVIDRLQSTGVHYVLHDELPLLGLTGL